MQPTLVDQYGRRITHLRLSLTDRCNFKCSYCLPGGVLCPLQKNSLLSIEQIEILTKAFCNLGINRIRLTGGEPLVREDILDVVATIKSSTQVPTLALTTNGSLLAPIAKHLKHYGLDRINISLDSLSKERFEKITKQDQFSDVMNGILATLDAKIPVKINAVIMKNVNDTEIDDFIEFGLRNNIEEVRFIEFMPLCGSKWQPEMVLPFNDIIHMMQKKYTATPITTEPGSVTESYQIQSGSQSVRIGFIRTLSKPFCGACSRVRISADGILRPCLFSHQGVSLRPLLLKSKSEELRETILNTVWNKPKGNEFSDAYDRHVSLSDHLLNTERNRSLYPSIRNIGG